MSIPEHHLDAVYTPGSIDEAAARPPVARIVGAFFLPLFFVVSFVLAYVSAFHAPVPHDLALTVAGPASTTSQLTSAIDRRAPGAFDITRTTSAAAARAGVEDRSAVGAIVIGTSGSGSAVRPTVTVLVAGAEGQVATQAVRQVGTLVGQRLGTTAVVQDLVPVAEADSTGTGLFYLIVISSIGGYLTITVLYQAMPRARRRTKLLTAILASVLTPLITIAALSLSLGVWGADFGHIAAVVGIDMIYVLVVALIALFFSEVLGQAAIIGVLVFALALNFPSTGGSIPESMLPPFWQAIHAVWFGSGALESFRSLIYFGGDGFGWPFTRLLIWLLASSVAVGAVLVYKGRRARASCRKHEAADRASVPHGTEVVAVGAV